MAWWRIIRGAVHKFFADHGLFLAAGLAFYLLLYCFPLVLIVISLLGYAVAAEEALSILQVVLSGLLPSNSRQQVSDALAVIVANRDLLGVTGLVILLIFSTAVFSAVRVVLNLVFGARQSRPMWHGVGIDVLMMFAVVTLVMAAAGIVWTLSLVHALLERLPGGSLILQPGWLPGRAAGLVVAFVLCYVLYRFSPSETLAPRALLIASGTGAVLFEVSKSLFGWYLGVAEGYAAIYGALGGVLFFCLWLYYACVVFIFGAALGWAYQQHDRLSGLEGAGTG
ncbi:YihY/virulence factor BrkB family protein [Candidatus Nitrospira bockiana]